MLKVEELQGIFVPVVTPFAPDGEIDWASYERYADRLLKQEVQGLVVNGTTGESPAVEWEEVRELVRVTKERVRLSGRHVPVVVGTGTNATAATVRRTAQAGEWGADAALVVVPYYSRPAQEGIAEHFRRAAEPGVPVVVYEIPSRTGVRLTPETARTILALDGVIGMKDSSGGTGLLSELGRGGSAKPILCGDDPLLLAMLEAGAAGGILAAANVRTGAFAAVCRLARAGRREEASDAFERLLPTIRLLFRESNPAPLKWLLARQGAIACDALRLPMTPIGAELREALEAAEA